MRLLSYHGHLAFGHQVFNTFVNCSNCIVQIFNLILFNSGSFCHCLDFGLFLLFVALRLFIPRMDGQGHLLDIRPIFHIAKNERVLTGHCSIEPKDTFLVLPLTVDHRVVGVQDEEIYQLVLLFGAWRSIDEEGTSDVGLGLGRVLVD